MDLPILALSKKLGDLTQTSIIMSSVFKPSGDDHVTIPTEHVDKSLTFKVSPSRHLQDITAVSLGLNHSAFINGKTKKLERYLFISDQYQVNVLPVDAIHLDNLGHQCHMTCHHVLYKL